MLLHCYVVSRRIATSISSRSKSKSQNRTKRELADFPTIYICLSWRPVPAPTFSLLIFLFSSKVLALLQSVHSSKCVYIVLFDSPP